MHWIKGSPNDFDTQGEYRELTFYEQIDDGRPWTMTKKLLMIVPTALYVAIGIPSAPTESLALLLPVWPQTMPS